MEPLERLTPKAQFINGYSGRLLRIDLSTDKTAAETLDEPTLKKYLGGAALGIKYIYNEVPSGVQWSDQDNRLTSGDWT